jgi:hypothetical protein
MTWSRGRQCSTHTPLVVPGGADVVLVVHSVAYGSVASDCVAVVLLVAVLRVAFLEQPLVQLLHERGVRASDPSPGVSVALGQ